jgi:hypothetical protein
MPEQKRRSFLRDNGLSLVYLGLFLACTAGQSVAGFRSYNDSQEEHSQPQVSYPRYLAGAHFWQALAENWESEFLQMGTYVLFTVFLFQKGSSESKDPEGEEEVDQEPGPGRLSKDAPWPMRVGGLPKVIYRNSLGMAFMLLFILSFALHAYAGAAKYNDEETAHGRPAITVNQFVLTSEFWFESMQNWQSEFLAVFSMVFLSIFLRQKGSPESKPVAAANSSTGE